VKINEITGDQRDLFDMIRYSAVVVSRLQAINAELRNIIGDDDLNRLCDSYLDIRRYLIAMQPVDDPELTAMFQQVFANLVEAGGTKYLQESK
jgi:hypothetical protein